MHEIYNLFYLLLNILINEEKICSSHPFYRVMDETKIRASAWKWNQIIILNFWVFLKCSWNEILGLYFILIMLKFLFLWFVIFEFGLWTSAKQIFPLHQDMQITLKAWLFNSSRTIRQIEYHLRRPHHLLPSRLVLLRRP